MVTRSKKSKPDAIKAIEDKLRSAGVPNHMFHVRKVPPAIEISILLGCDRYKIPVRSKANSRDTDEAIRRAAETWLTHKTGMFSPDAAE